MVSSGGPEPASTPLKVTDVGELVGALPLLLGFRPVNSLVLVTDAGTRPQGLGAVLRVDLPVGAQHIRPWVTELRQTVATAGATTATIVVIGGEGTDSGTNDRIDDGSSLPGEPLPYRFLVHRLTAALVDAGIQVGSAVWASTTDNAARWQCYESCQRSGPVQDRRTSPLVAALTVAGATTRGSRDQLAATLAPDPADQLARQAAMLDTHVPTTPGTDPTEDRDAGRVVQEAIAAAANTTGLPVLDDEQVVQLTLALSHPEVRDYCLAVAVSEHAGAAERLWTVLTRATPAPERAEPACLLALHAHLRGDGALANIALDNALDGNPEHGLAQLLLPVFSTGMPPVELERYLRQAVTPTDPTTTDSASANAASRRSTR